jgi:hypothetical protein
LGCIDRFNRRSMGGVCVVVDRTLAKKVVKSFNDECG